MNIEGNTSNQMLSAPKNAVFVWVNANIDYPARLAKELGREDLQIVSPSWLEMERWRGGKFSGIILDHAVMLTENKRHYWHGAITRVLKDNHEENNSCK